VRVVVPRRLIVKGGSCVGSEVKAAIEEQQREYPTRTSRDERARESLPSSLSGGAQHERFPYQTMYCAVARGPAKDEVNQSDYRKGPAMQSEHFGPVQSKDSNTSKAKAGCQPPAWKCKRRKGIEKGVARPFDRRAAARERESLAAGFVGKRGK